MWGARVCNLAVRALGALPFPRGDFEVPPACSSGFAPFGVAGLPSMGKNIFLTAGKEKAEFKRIARRRYNPTPRTYLQP